MTPKQRCQVEAQLTAEERKTLKAGLARAKREGWSKEIRTAQDLFAVAEGCWFEERYAAHAVAFFESGLTHATGDFAGQPFTLLDWQRDQVIRPLFGWRRKDAKGQNVRRHQSAFIFIAKKNGKSTLCGGLILYQLVGEPSPADPSKPEPAQEVYAASTSREVASIIYRETKKLAQASPALAKRLTVKDSTRRLVYHQMGSFFRVLPHKADSAEGMIAGGVYLDEVHAMKSRDLYAALRWAGSSRSQPLVVEVTTAGVNDPTALWVERHAYSTRVAAGEFRDTTHLAAIFEADADAKLDDLDQLRKANPSLGHTLDADRLVAEARQALQGGPAAQADFKRYRMNIAVGSAQSWIDLDQWDRGQSSTLDLDQLTDVPCLAGLDLAKVSDFTALLLLWPGQDGERWRCWPWFWLPQAAVDERTARGDHSYQAWADQGLITVTDGDTTDHKIVRADINRLAERFTIRQIGIDRNFEGWQFTQDLFEDDELPAVGVGQGWRSQDVPMQRLDALIREGRLDCGGHPIMRWMAGNAIAQKNGPNECLSLNRAKVRDKIDGIAALINAMFLAEATPEEDDEAPYEECPLVMLD